MLLRSPRGRSECAEASSDLEGAGGTDEEFNVVHVCDYWLWTCYDIQARGVKGYKVHGV